MLALTEDVHIDWIRDPCYVAALYFTLVPSRLIPIHRMHDF